MIGKLANKRGTQSIYTMQQKTTAKKGEGQKSYFPVTCNEAHCLKYEEDGCRSYNVTNALDFMQMMP